MLRHWYNRFMNTCFSFTCWCENDTDEMARTLLSDFAHALAKYEPLSLERAEKKLSIKGPYRYIDKRFSRSWIGLDKWTGPPDISVISSAQICVEPRDRAVRVNVELCFGEWLHTEGVLVLFVVAYFILGIGLVKGLILGLVILIGGIFITLLIWWLSRVVAARRFRKVLVRQAQKHGRT